MHRMSNAAEDVVDASTRLLQTSTSIWPSAVLHQTRMGMDLSKQTFGRLMPSPNASSSSVAAYIGRLHRQA